MASSQPTMTDFVSYKGGLADWAVAVLSGFLSRFFAQFTNMRLALLSFVVAALSVQQAVSIPFDKRDAPAPAPAPTINGMYYDHA